MKHRCSKIKRWLSSSCRIRISDIRYGYLGGILMMLIAVLIRLISGSPYRIYFLLRQTHILPPLALISLFNLLVTAAMGFACGLVLSCHRCKDRINQYRGGMLFVLLTVFWFISYPLLFRGGFLLAALLSLAIVWILALGCTFAFLHVQKLSGWISAIFLFWTTYLVITLLSCILCI